MKKNFLQQFFYFPGDEEKKKREVKQIVFFSCFFLLLTWLELYLLQVSRSLSFSDTFFFLSLINFNVLVFLFLVFLIFKNFIKIFGDHSKAFGKSLKTKLISAFIFFSFIPTGIVALLSVFYLNNSFSKWFDYKITDALAKVVRVGDYYQDSVKRSNYRFAYIFQKEFQERFKKQGQLSTGGQARLVNNFVSSFKEKYSLEKVDLYNPNKWKLFISSRTDLLNLKGVDGVNLQSFSKVSGLGGQTLVESFLPFSFQGRRFVLSVGSFVSTNFLTQSQDIDEIYKVLNKESFIFASSKMVYFSTLILMVLLIIFMATWFGFYLAKRLTAPVELLSQTSHKIAKGEVLDVSDLILFQSLDSKSTSHEFHQLLKDFQFMAEEIRKSKIETLKMQRVEAWAEVARRMAHEVKNPLTPISLSAQRLNKLFSQTLNDERFDKSIKMIVDHTTILKNLVNEFALFSRLPSTKLQRHSVIDLLKDIILFYTESAPHIKFTLNAEVDEFDCFFDKEQINRVLMNLVTNSIESMKGVAVAEIKIAIFKTGKSVTIKITDNGPGFKPDMLGRVFEPYITGKTSGTGLGLSIVDKILKEHGGSVKACNLKPCGAEVSISFPLAKNKFV